MCVLQIFIFASLNKILLICVLWLSLLLKIFTWRSRNREIISYAKWDPKTKRIVNISSISIKKKVCVCVPVNGMLLLLLLRLPLCYCFITKMGFTLVAFNLLLFCFHSPAPALSLLFLLSNFVLWMWLTNCFIFFISFFNKCVIYYYMCNADNN